MSGSGDATATLQWLADLMVAPVALVLDDGERPHCNAALERMLSGESEAGRQRVRAALVRLGREMHLAQNGDKQAAFDVIDEALLRLRTSARRYLLEPVPAPPDAAFPGVIRVHRSRFSPHVGALQTRYGLTAREEQIAWLLAAGFSNKSIAAELKLSPHTVRRHTESVFRKVGVTSRAALSSQLHR